MKFKILCLSDNFFSLEDQVILQFRLCRVIKMLLCTWGTMKNSVYSNNPHTIDDLKMTIVDTFGMLTVLYWTRSSRTQFGVLINEWRLAGDTLNITWKFLYCNHQVHRDFWSLFINICLYDSLYSVLLLSLLFFRSPSRPTVRFILWFSYCIKQIIRCCRQ
jgi:hypothetical protein